MVLSENFHKMFQPKLLFLVDSTYFVKFKNQIMSFNAQYIQKMSM